MPGKGCLLQVSPWRSALCLNRALLRAASPEHTSQSRFLQTFVSATIWGGSAVPGTHLETPASGSVHGHRPACPLSELLPPGARRKAGLQCRPASGELPGLPEDRDCGARGGGPGLSRTASALCHRPSPGAAPATRGFPGSQGPLPAARPREPAQQRAGHWALPGARLLLPSLSLFQPITPNCPKSEGGGCAAPRTGAGSPRRRGHGGPGEAGGACWGEPACTSVLWVQGPHVGVGASPRALP